MTLKQLVEDISAISTVNAGSGNIAGIGVGPAGEPGKVIKKTKFAGIDVFDVDKPTFDFCRMGKAKYKHWKSYVGEDVQGHAIREYANRYPRKPIILRCEDYHGAMLFVRGNHLNFTKGTKL